MRVRELPGEILEDPLLSILIRYVYIDIYIYIDMCGVFAFET